jgi:glycosyltransferase involved in cell wall biosynthesis
VDDGSTDTTAEIIESYTKRYPWIELVRRREQSRRSFAGKVHAFNVGLEPVQQSLEFEVIGNLDADLSFDPKYLRAIWKALVKFKKVDSSQLVVDPEQSR